MRDATLNFVGVCDDLIKLVATRRWLGVGGFILTVPSDSEALETLLAPGAGIVVMDGDMVLFSGPVDSGPDEVAVARRELANADTVGTDIVTITGADDLVWLADRLVHPSPVSGNVAAQAYDVRAGLASTVILAYVSANCGPGAMTDRRTPGLVLGADPGVGAFVTGAGRWQNLAGFVAELAHQGGIGISAAQTGRQIVVSALAPADRTEQVVFSPQMGNVQAATVETTRVTGTAVYVAGQGEGTLRQVAVATSGAVRRVETFVDRRDIDNLPELQVIAAAELVNAVGAPSITVDPIETSSFRYGTDYELGDLVGVQIGSVRSSERIMTTELTLTADGFSRALTLGQPVETGVAGLVQLLRKQSARIGHLERI